MNLRKIAIVALSLLSSSAFADEGMWMIGNLSARTDSILRSIGFELTHEQLYSIDKPSLNDAIVQFGGFCSGVVVSNEGLVFTNHHCGFDAIQSHSTTKHDYLEDGFFAKKYKEELPNEGLYVDFHIKTIDVTERLWEGLQSTFNKQMKVGNPLTREEEIALDSIAQVLCGEVEDTVLNIYGDVVPYYRGEKYYMSVYQRYEDVRLVFAPPQSLGKFGGDTDNWVWPRQTCDFSVFRIYADKQNRPAKYSKENVPLRPKNYAHISLQGYQPGSYCMTLGYPGSTERYLSSYGILNTMKNVNEVRVQVRGIKQDVMKKAMNSSQELRIKYASKYAQSSNYWKYSIGQNQALNNLGVVAEKQALEKALPQDILDSLKVCYETENDNNYVINMLQESFISGSDILQFAIMSMIRQVADGEQEDFQKKVQDTYKDIDIPTDKAIFSAMIKNYKENVSKEHWPDFFEVVDSLLDGDVDEFTNMLFNNSKLTDMERLKGLKSYTDIYDDPMFDIASSILGVIFTHRPSDRIDYFEGELEKALRREYKDKEYYPDANFTLRMSFGIVEGYETAEANYICYTLPQSLLDKNNNFPENDDYRLPEKVKSWFEKGNFGKRYEDKNSGKMQLCFLTNNDITGGNSGSGMFDGKGRLIGLAFDGNWEAMSGDLKFDNKLQRCIGVDIRYVLSVIENYGKAKRLIKELTLE